MTPAAEVFARAVLAFEPYAAELVYVRGWVHAMYLAATGAGSRPVTTDDVDVSLPLVLAPAGRPTLRQLAEQAGFVPHRFADSPASVSQLICEVADPRSGIHVVDLDLLTEASAPRSEVPIGGQPDLVAQGYPGQRLLQEQAQWIEVGVRVHPLLDPPRRIRVPSLAAYVLQKGIASASRHIFSKMVKDLVYIYEIMRDARLGPITVDGLRVLAREYPTEYRSWRQQLAIAIGDLSVRRSMAQQVVFAAGTFGAQTAVEALIAAQFERVLEETPGP